MRISFFSINTICLSILAAACFVGGISCRRNTHPVGETLKPVAAPHRAANQKALSIGLTRGELTERLLARLDHRLLARRIAPREIERVVTEVSPIVSAASRQSSVRSGLRRIASRRGETFEQARRYWVSLQEADLLLEAGGDPDAVSTSHAVGVAQWMLGTARGVGLKVDLRESDRLTLHIDDLKRRIAWDTYLLGPTPDPGLPGAPMITRDGAATELPGLRATMQILRARRKAVDARYDPEKAIFAQTRYLLGLYARFPSPDWIFQAYHGGEGGVSHLLKLYTGSDWRGNAARAIEGAKGEGRLRYEDVYFGATPHAHRAAFTYLYGRSDDHRHYWWKLRASANALAEYRRDPAAFQRRWESLLPGRLQDASWYPEGPEISFQTLASIEQSRDRLMPVEPGPEYKVRPAPLDPIHAREYSTLRPESLGALLLVIEAYHRAGGTGIIEMGDLTLTQQYVLEARRLHPPRPIPGPIWPPSPQPAPGKRRRAAQGFRLPHHGTCF